MRIKLTLKPIHYRCEIPINYQYPLSAAIYKMLEQASAEYADWLHNHGYMGANGKPMKLFVFSRLNIPKLEARKNLLIAHDKTPCTLYISSPMMADFLQNLIFGLFMQQTIEIANKYTVAKFIIENVETTPPPAFYNLKQPELNLKFKCLSPFIVSIMKHNNDKSYYLRYDDPELSTTIHNNLLNKFEAATGKQPQNQTLKFSLDQEYIKRQQANNKPISKLIKIKEGSTEETEIKCIQSLFTLTGSSELIWCAYECGIGEKNSLGLGMIEQI